MYRFLILVLINMLCVMSAYSASEQVTTFPTPVYIYGGVEFSDLDSAYTHLKSRYERDEPWGTGVATFRIISISPWVNAYNPSYNGIASKYVTEMERCLPNGLGCSTFSGGTIDVSMRCAESVSFTTRVIGTGIDRTLHCVRSIPVDKSKSDCDVVKNPILVATGEKIQRETDYRSADGVLEFSRTYRAGGGSGDSASPATMSFTDNTNPLFKPSDCFSSFYTEGTAAKTRVPYCFKYVVSPTVGDFDYTVRLESGRKLLFKNVSGQIKNQGSTGERLSKKIDELGANEWVLHNTDGSVIFFDVNGRAKRKQLRTGKIVTYSYSTATTPTDIAPLAGELIEVADDQGRKLQLKYNNRSQLTNMIDPHGNIFSYTYDSVNNLTSVTYPAGATRHYLFAELSNINNGVACSGSSNAYSKLLTGIVDEKGIRYADYKYDCSARAISTEHSGGAQKALLAFNSDGSTTVTNELNKKTIYRFKNIGGVSYISSVDGQASTNCAAANKAYTYTAEGWIASKTDWNGIKTTFTYNTAGQEISRTEAFGTPEARTVTTEWHPTLFVKTKITEPGKEIIYSYDANGRLLNQSAQSTIVQ